MAYKPYDDETIQRLIDGDPSLGLIAQQPRPQRKHFATALQREQESVQEADMLGYQARIVVQCSLPYRRQLVNKWTRRNGGVTLTLWTPKDIGLPYGAIPRLLLLWVVSEVVRTHQRRIELHDSLTYAIYPTFRFDTACQRAGNLPFQRPGATVICHHYHHPRSVHRAWGR